MYNYNEQYKQHNMRHNDDRFMIFRLNMDYVTGLSSKTLALKYAVILN